MISQAGERRRRGSYASQLPLKPRGVKGASYGDEVSGKANYVWFSRQTCINRPLNQSLGNRRRGVQIRQMQQTNRLGLAIGKERALHLMKFQPFRFPEARIHRGGGRQSEQGDSESPAIHHFPDCPTWKQLS